MSGMVRKQIYLERRQVQAIRQKAQAVGANESELIRQAIDHDLFGSGAFPTRPDPSVWAEIETFILALASQTRQGEALQFDRNEIYEPRVNRFDETDPD